MAGVKQYETDIAIVGAGGAGVAAGIEARDAGARAIAFEKSSEPGGAAIISGGGCLIVGSPLQQRNGRFPMSAIMAAVPPPVVAAIGITPANRPGGFVASPGLDDHICRSSARPVASAQVTTYLFPSRATPI